MEEEKVKRFLESMLQRLSEDNGELTVSPHTENAYLITEEDLLRDIEIFADEIFDAQIERIENGVSAKFKNGQIFEITIKETLKN